MNFRGIAALVSIAWFGMPVFGANGFSVTTTWRFGCWNWTSKVPEGQTGDACSKNMEWGNIIKCTILNTQVSRVDTLVSIKTAMCQYPAISTDGKNVAFYRWKYYADGMTLKQAGSDYIAIVSANGGTIKNLVALANDPGYDAHLDWPSDGWIYYVKPRPASGGWADGNEIWKVNPYASDPASTNQLAASIPAGGYIRRFSLSQQANRMALQVYCVPNQSCSAVNQLQEFPGGKVLFGAGGCNMKISASGNFEGHFGGGTHDNTEINGWNGSTFTLVPGCSWTNSRCSIWNGFKWSGFDMSSTGPGVEQICWSSNSDKWVCENVMWQYSCQKCGTNQMLINWKDGQAIFATKHPNVPNNGAGEPKSPTESLNAFAGDMWIQPPAGHDYAYEDTLGTWHDLTKPAGYGNITAAVDHNRVASGALVYCSSAAGRLSIDLPDANQTYRISIIDMAGRAISSISARNNATVEIAGQAHGARIVRISDNNGYEAAMKIAPAR